MAFFETHLFSTSLCFGTDLNVFLPTPNVDDLMEGDGGYFYDGEKKFQVLYLLHGGYGDYTDWMRLTSIERYAQAHRLAVIMPSASNSFYQNMAYGSDYFSWIAEEMPRFCRKMFPISQKRENTFIGGLSMGGYGALKVAFEKPEEYACAFSLSGAVDVAASVEAAVTGGNGRGARNPFKGGEKVYPIDVKAVFGTDRIEGTDADLFTLVEKRRAEGRALPRVFQSIGTEDFLYPSNQAARERLKALGVDLTYEEHPGAHNWDYWDANVQRALAWLPLKNDCVEE